MQGFGNKTSCKQGTSSDKALVIAERAQGRELAAALAGNKLDGKHTS